MSFQQFDLDSKFLRALDACGFTTPTEVQRQAIPLALAGRDLMASAQTGTGKTAAFVLPTLQRLLGAPGGKGNGPRALILTPTRELATQVTDTIHQLGRATRLRYGAIVGGTAYGPQFRLLGAPLDVLVATPGRLIDHMERGSVDFSRLEVLVLDEADRMLDMGFVKDVDRIASATPKGRQTMLFSATLEGGVLGVARRHLTDPAQVQLAGNKKRHEGIDQWMHQVDDLKHKKAILSHLLADPAMSQAVVFTATKRRAKTLAADLASSGLKCAPLHGNMTQAARRRTVEHLRRGKVQILVATDVAARGLDVPGISHVINFELPMTSEDYIHRIGRTGRAGASGIAITLVERQEWHKLTQIERLTGRAMERKVLPGLEPTAAEPTSAPRRGPRQPSPGPRRQGNGWKSASGGRNTFGRGPGRGRNDRNKRAKVR